MPVLLMTGTFDVVDESRVHACGAAGITVGPLEPLIVIKRVKDLLGMSSKDTETRTMRLVTSTEPPARPVAAANPPANDAGPAEPTSDLEASRSAGSDAAGQDTRVPPEPEVRHQSERSGTSVPAGESAAPTPPAASGGYLDQRDKAFEGLDKQLSGTSSSRSGVRHTAPAIGMPSPNATSTGSPERPVFDIDEEWFEGALEVHRRTLSSSVAPRQPAARTGGDSSALRPEGPAEPEQASVASAAPRATYGTPLPVPGVADSFHALLAVDEGAPTRAAAAAPPVLIPDEAVDRIAQRVADRLSEGVFVETVRRVVEDVAERLVREEIARIRASVKEQKR